MSAPHYNYDICIEPCRDKAQGRRIAKHLAEAWFPVDDWTLEQGDEPGTWRFSGWAKDVQVPALPTDDEDRDESKHAWIVAAFPGRRVITRWRCVEYDDWDAEFDTDEPDDEED